MINTEISPAGFNCPTSVAILKTDSDPCLHHVVWLASFMVNTVIIYFLSNSLLLYYHLNTRDFLPKTSYCSHFFSNRQ